LSEKKPFKKALMHRAEDLAAQFRMCLLYSAFMDGFDLGMYNIYMQSAEAFWIG